MRVGRGGVDFGDENCRVPRRHEIALSLVRLSRRFDQFRRRLRLAADAHDVGEAEEGACLEVEEIG